MVSTDSFLPTAGSYNNMSHPAPIGAYGHISGRNPSHPTTFFLSYSVASALVSSADDLVEYHIDDAEPVKEGDKA